MHSVLALPSWMDAQYWLDLFGPWALWGAVAIIFAECGLLLGFFLPGDSLLFTVGLLTTTGLVDTTPFIKQPLWLCCVVLTAAAVAGNVSGYEIGRRTGPAIFRREDSRLFKKEHVDKTVGFFEKYGPRAIVLARFVPIVRTFITVTAGVGRMDRRRYLVYSGIGGTAWATGVTLLGALLGRFEFIKKNIEAMLLLIVLISVVPIGIEFLRERASRRREAAAGHGHTPGAGTPDAGMQVPGMPGAEFSGSAHWAPDAPASTGAGTGTYGVPGGPVGWASDGAPEGPTPPRSTRGGRHVI
jgi:membrane-associated protein